MTFLKYSRRTCSTTAKTPTASSNSQTLALPKKPRCTTHCRRRATRRITSVRTQAQRWELGRCLVSQTYRSQLLQLLKFLFIYLFIIFKSKITCSNPNQWVGAQEGKIGRALRKGRVGRLSLCCQIISDTNQSWVDDSLSSQCSITPRRLTSSSLKTCSCLVSHAFCLINESYLVGGN